MNKNEAKNGNPVTSFWYELGCRRDTYQEALYWANEAMLEYGIVAWATAAKSRITTK